MKDLGVGRSKSFVWLCVLLVLLIFYGGCMSRPLAVTGHQKTYPTEHRPYINVVAADNDLTGILWKKLRVARQHTGWTQDGRLVINVEFENRTLNEMHLQIQTVFKDANDNFLPDQTPWKITIFPRNTTTLYTATALDKKAERAHVRVRRAKRNL